MLKIQYVFQKITSVVKDAETLEPLSTDTWNAKWYSPCGKVLTVPQKAKQRTTI